MKLNIMSDLHLAYKDLELNGGEVLILAGDVCESHIFDTHAKRFFAEEMSKYEQVFYIMGNHEHYGNKYYDTKKELLKKLPSNVTILEKEYIEVSDIIIMGATLWTDCNKGCPITKESLKNFMSDYNYISFKESGRNTYRKLHPNDTLSEHKGAMTFFKKTIKNNPDKEFVIVTHHAPSYLSISEEFTDDHYGNGGFVSDLSGFILDNPQIKLWVHGHTHSFFDYRIGDTRVICNPRGIEGIEQRAKEFDVNFTVEI